MFDHKPQKRTVFVIHPQLKTDRQNPEPKLQEAVRLAHAIDLEVIYSDTINIGKIIPATFIGSGQAEKIKEKVEEQEPDVVIINEILSPIQQRNLEKKLGAKVIDRTGLILEIFGARAQTKEGTLQVELAALSYQRSRLVRSWTHLERQRGGLGFVGGPGETQIEIDRRLIGERIKRIKEDLKSVRRTRKLAQARRNKSAVPVIALIGYTNAGKSTLFNTLTGAKVMAKDMLFATLDPTMRKINLGQRGEKGQDAVLSDTVGFITDLPTHLIEAFKATLEQINEATIIIHVRDVTDPKLDDHKQDVIDIMDQLGMEYETDDRIIEVYNKIDDLNEEELQDFNRITKYQDNAVMVSAIKGEGLDDLKDMIKEKLKTLT